MDLAWLGVAIVIVVIWGVKQHVCVSPSLSLCLENKLINTLSNVLGRQIDSVPLREEKRAHQISYLKVNTKRKCFMCFKDMILRRIHHMLNVS